MLTSKSENLSTALRSTPRLHSNEATRLVMQILNWNTQDDQEPEKKNHEIGLTLTIWLPTYFMASYLPGVGG